MLSKLFSKLSQHPGLVVFLTALMIRVGFAFYSIQVGPAFTITDDSQRYDRLALNLVHRFQFRAEPFILEKFDLPQEYEERVLRPGHLTDTNFFDGPDVKRVPLFPLFLGIVYRIIGYNPHLYLFVQAILGSITCWLIYRIGLIINKPDVGFLAGILLAINPRTVLHVGQIQVEVYFIWINVLLFWTMLRYIRSQSWRMTIVFASLLGWTTLSREMAYYFIVLFLPAILYPLFKYKKYKFKNLLLKAGLLIIIPVLAIFGWNARNHHHYGYYIWTAHTAFSEVWIFSPQILAASWNVPQNEARLRILEKVSNEYPEYKTDYERLKNEPLYYWKFNHRVEMNIRSVSIARPYLLKNISVTLSTFASGAFWSLWAGIGEWRSILLPPGKYEQLKTSLKINKAKVALARFELAKCLGITYSILKSFPPKVYIVFGYIWLLMLFLYGTAFFGIKAFWMINPIMTIELLIMIAFFCAVTGPTGNNRLFTLAYPFVSLLSAQGFFVIRKYVLSYKKNK